MVRNKYVIVTDNKGRKGVAKCHPDDKFDLQVGVKLALERYCDKTINVGDKVTIKNRGLCYTTFDTWVEKHIEDRQLVAKYCYGYCPDNGGEYVVLYKDRKVGKSAMCYIGKRSFRGITNCHLIEEEGLERI